MSKNALPLIMGFFTDNENFLLSITCKDGSDANMDFGSLDKNCTTFFFSTSLCTKFMFTFFYGEKGEESDKTRRMKYEIIIIFNLRGMWDQDKIKLSSLLGQNTFFVKDSLHVTQEWYVCCLQRFIRDERILHIKKFLYFTVRRE